MLAAVVPTVCLPLAFATNQSPPFKSTRTTTKCRSETLRRATLCHELTSQPTQCRLAPMIRDASFVVLFAPPFPPPPYFHFRQPPTSRWEQVRLANCCIFSKCPFAAVPLTCQLKSPSHPCVVCSQLRKFVMMCPRAHPTTRARGARHTEAHGVR